LHAEEEVEMIEVSLTQSDELAIPDETPEFNRGVHLEEFA
jgi:hypothetical protein